METLSSMDLNFNIDKISYEIFSILESKFLFGYEDQKLRKQNSVQHHSGKIRILSIDGGNMISTILAAKSLCQLEHILQQKSRLPDARIADFFDVATGFGLGGVLTAMLFTKGINNRPLFTADECLNFLLQNRKNLWHKPRTFLQKIFNPAKSERIFRQIFSDLTLKDTIKPVLIPCYDLTSEAPFLFSRADAMEIDGFDFKIRDVCLATTTVNPSVELTSVNKKTRILAMNGVTAVTNPSASAITHVLNNKTEFPFTTGIEDILLLSFGNAEPECTGGRRRKMTLSPERYVQIAGIGISELIDQAVSMAFGPNKTNYVRIQANSFEFRKSELIDARKSDHFDHKMLLKLAEEMLQQKNIESTMFRGKKVSDRTNEEKIDWFADEVIKEQERRKSSIFPTVLFRNVPTSLSSACF